MDDPGFFRLQVEAAYGRAADLGEFDGSGFGFVDWAARAVGGEDGRRFVVEDAAQGDEAFAASATAGASDGAEAEELQGARDEFAVEALADEDCGVCRAEVEGAGQDALVPEGVDFAARG